MSLFNLPFTQKLLHFFTRPNNLTDKCEEHSQTSLTLNNIQHCCATSAGEQKRVLLISADNGNRDELMNQLDIWGYQTVTCRTPEEALEQLARSTEKIDPLHFLILDRRRLEVDPGEFIKSLQNNPVLEQLTTILVGSHLPEQEQASLKQAGYHCLVSAPLNKRLLFSALQSSVESSGNTAGITNLSDKFQETHPRLEPIRVLLATDDCETHEQATKILENEGHVICVAEDGHQALNALETDIFDLAIIDAELPVLSGIQVINIHHLDCPIGQWMPFILLSEEDNHNHEQYYQYSRIKACLSKPVNNQHLIQTLNKLIKQQDPTKSTRPVKTAWSDKMIVHANTTQTPSLINLQTLKDLESIGTNSDFIDQLIHLFEYDGKKTLHQLADAAKQQDMTRFKEMAHLLLDSASQIGATQLYVLTLYASQIDQAGFIKNSARINEEIITSFDETYYELIQYLAEKTDSLSNS